VILTIAGKELRRLFASPLAWVLLAFLQVVLAWVFLGRLDEYLVAQPQIAMMPTAPGVTEYVVIHAFGWVLFLLLILIPLLSMRLIAEERRNHTLPFLISAPVSATQIVLGKFLGLLAFLALAVGLPVLMAASLYAGGRLDLGLLGGNVLGLLLLCSTFTAVGLYLSSLTAHPLVAGVGTFAVLLGLWLISAFTTNPDSVLNMISLIKHYESFARGTLALGDLVYYLVLTALFLLLSIRRLDADRLRT